MRIAELLASGAKRPRLRELRQRFEACTRDARAAVREVEHHPDQALDVMEEFVGNYGESDNQARFGELRQSLAAMRAESDALQQIKKSAVDDPSAVEAFRAYVAAHSDSRLAHLYLAGALSRCGDHEAAIATYRETLLLSKRATDRITVQIQIGRELDAKGDVDGAIAHLRSLLAEPDREAARFLALVHLYLGNSLLKSGDTRSARASWKQAVKTDWARPAAKEARQMLLQHR